MYQICQQRPRIHPCVFDDICHEMQINPSPEDAVGYSTFTSAAADTDREVFTLEGKTYALKNNLFYYLAFAFT